MIKKDKYKKKTIDKEELSRIYNLFETWWKLLWSLAISYLTIYAAWSSIQEKLTPLKNFGSAFDYKYLQVSSKILVLISLVFVRGIMFCFDGLITSWLKSPFGQICYSINKADINEELADKIVTVLTEIQENFKETFKKFGILAISSDIMNFFSFVVINAKKKEVENINIATNLKKKTGNFLIDSSISIIKYSSYLSTFWNLSLLIPIIYAWFRIKFVRKLIKDIKIVEKDE